MEQVTEEVKAVKIDEKPKETKTEVVDEVDTSFTVRYYSCATVFDSY